MPSEHVSFSSALGALKEGKHVRRAGWHRSGMRVYAVQGARSGEVLSGAFLVLAISDTALQPGWVASTADLFAEDWEVLP